MKADPFQIGDVLKDQKRFVVPIYQRTYAWKIEPQLKTFFAQVEAKAKERLAGDGRYPHYMGAVLVIPRSKFSFGHIVILDVVDGQQRLTTFQIFLAALRDLAEELGAENINSILGSFLTNPEGPQMKDRVERYKVYPTAYDRKLFCDLIDLSYAELRTKYADSFYGSGRVRESASPLLRGWGYFRDEALSFVTDAKDRIERLDALSAALLEGFQVIMITLDEQDDAQTIFETLNSGGEPLAAMDLVRNDVFHRAARGAEDVDSLMEQRWSRFETPFWKEHAIRGRIRKPQIDFFLSDTLAAETGKEILLTELYSQYKAFVRERAFKTVDSELETLLRHAPTYVSLVKPNDESPLTWLGRQLRVFDVTTAYPLVFIIAESAASEEQKSALYRLIVSYVVRRMLCGLTAKNYNNTFVRVANYMRTNGVSLDTGKLAFETLAGDTVRFPSDEDLAIAIASRRQYGNIQQRRLQHILAEIELAQRDRFDESTSLRNDLTIEHIMPDNWCKHWPLPDGTTASQDLITGMSEANLSVIREREALKHTLGNLTLLTDARNPSIGNSGFSTKQVQLRASLLKMNHEIAKQPTWSENQIRARANQLFKIARIVWPGIS